jgi:outer membrane protein assembly factor BamB
MDTSRRTLLRFAWQAPAAGLAVSLRRALAGAGADRPASGAAADWPSFRGRQAAGVAEGFALPARFSAAGGEGVVWKTRIPGLGHCSPVVAGGRVFVTTAISGRGDAALKVGLYGDIEPVNDATTHQWKVYCLDRKTGRIEWERTAHEGVPAVKRHPKSTHANSTMAVGRNRAAAFFGSEGLYCYDFEGALVWKKDFGVLDSGYFQVPEAQWGFASSPVIAGDKVIVQCDVQKNSFLAALELASGHEIWRTARQDVPTWSTPTVVDDGARPQVIVNGYRHAGGYDLETGRELWRLSGGAGDIPVPTPVLAEGMVFLTSAHGSLSPIYAIRLEARGDISLAEGQTANDSIVWSYPRGGAYMQTPLVYGGHLYVCRDNGVLSCYEAGSGERVYQERLGSGGGFSASPVAADGKIYYTSETGDVYVVGAGAEFKLLATNALGEICMATPAISEGALLFRGQDHVIAVGA